MKIQIILLGLLAVVAVESFPFEQLRNVNQDQKKLTLFDKMGSRYFTRERQVQTARLSLEAKQEEERYNLQEKQAIDWKDLNKFHEEQRELFRVIYNFKGKFSDELVDSFEKNTPVETN